MKNNKKRYACILAAFIFIFTYIAANIVSIDAYANEYQDYKEYTIAYTSKSSSSSSRPKSSSFSSGSSKKSYSTAPKSTTIKPDSGSFSSSPKSNSNKSNNSLSNSKVDSGSFSTKPNNSNANKNSSNNNDDYSGSSSSRPIFGGSRSYGGFYGGFYGGYSPFHRMLYGFSMSSWITKLVVILTVAVVAYIIIDYIRSKRD